MHYLLRLILLCFLIGIPLQEYGQDPGSEGRKTRRMWRKWRSKRMSFNPYLDKKKKNRPATKMQRENERVAKKTKKRFKRQFKKTQRRMGTKERKVD